MPSATPPRNLTQVLCQRLQAEMLKACEAVAVRHGLVVEPRDITGVDLRYGFESTFRVSIPLPDGTALDPERLRFEALTEAFDFSPPITVACSAPGASSSASPESTLAARSTLCQPSESRMAKGVRSTAKQVALLLQKRMKDVTPKG